VTVRVRIAPSPTGNLHIGTARTAVFNWLFARNQGGKFILRIEDTDLERSRPEYTQNILDGLTWLGLTWDEGPFFQSERLQLYRDAIKTLLDQGLAYKCYCTPEELDEMRSAQVAKGEAPRYDNRHRNLTRQQRADFEAEGRTAVIRFKIEDDRVIRWKDLVRGQVVWKASDLGGDMVIARAATANDIGQPLYNLAVVVDDMDMNISHVIRGEDHIANTAKQILLYEAFGAPVPEFAHTPLILNQSGQKLSKRDGVTSISDFQNMGFTPEGLANYMTLLGWSAPEACEIFTLKEAAEKFSFDRVNKAGAKFDWDKLDWINSQYLHQLPAEQLTDWLIPYWQEAGYEFDPEADRSWLEQLAGLIGPSLTRLKDSVDLSRIFFASSVELNEEGQKQLEQPGAIEALNAILESLDPAQSWSDDVAKDIIKRVTKEQKVKKGLVMRSLRVGLTGEVHGPDLIQSWGLLHQRGLDRTRLETVLKVDQKEVKPADDVKKSPTEADQKPPVSETPTPEVVAEVVADTPAAESEPGSQTTQVVAETPTDETPKEEEVVAETPTPETSKEEEVVAETPTPETSKEEAVVTETPTPETPKEEEVIAEAPTSEAPKEDAVKASDLESSTSVDEFTPPEAEASEDQIQKIGQTIVEVLSNLPDYVTTFFGEYQKPLITVGLIVAALVSIKVLVAVLNVFNTIPLVAPTLELVGMAYSLWFVYRYLLKSSTRSELSDQVKSFIEQIAGQNSSNS
jgi:glutamyl-tRNA synthetase